jgi:hypothetical protein
MSYFFEQNGGAKCGLCGSAGTNRSTCPMNPKAKNPNAAKHLLAAGREPVARSAIQVRRSPARKSPVRKSRSPKAVAKKSPKKRKSSPRSKLTGALRNTCRGLVQNDCELNEALCNWNRQSGKGKAARAAHCSLRSGKTTVTRRNRNAAMSATASNAAQARMMRRLDLD